VNAPGTLKATADVTRYTLVDLSNRRYLWWVVGIAIVLVSSIALIARFIHIGDLTTSQTVRTFAQTAALYYVLVVLVILGIGLVRSELDSGAAALVLSRPVSRTSYVAGRYLGNAAALVSSVAIMGLGSFLVVAVSGTTDWVLLYDFVVVAYNALLFLALMMLLGVLLGTVGSVAIVGFTYYALAGGNMYLLVALIDSGTVTGPGAALMRLVLLVLPHVLPPPLLQGQTMALGDTTLAMHGPTPLDLAWSLVWIAGPLALTVWRLGRRDL
jgi:ABC-type transport system involved in multi-copper enzyme maturation permease subunit